MKVKIDIHVTGATLDEPLIQEEDFEAIGAEIAAEQVKRVDSGLGAEGAALKRNERGLFLRRTGRMLNSLGVRAASDKGVTVGSSPRYAEKVQARWPWLSLDNPETHTRALLDRIEQRLGGTERHRTLI